jgi:hypothetical protein
VKIVVGSALLQMVKESKKRLLHNILSILGGYTETYCIPQQPCSHKVKKAQHFLFEGTILGCTRTAEC